ncbi:hypothetical protein E4535_23470, partial [Escherichia coli]|nr:hypothetical protein [Escherichia coli]
AGDRVNRQFVAERPDQLWVADFTYVSTWRGFVYVLHRRDGKGAVRVFPDGDTAEQATTQ